MPEHEKGGSFLFILNVTVNGATSFIFVFMKSSFNRLNSRQQRVMCSDSLRSFTEYSSFVFSSKKSRYAFNFFFLVTSAT